MKTPFNVRQTDAVTIVRKISTKLESCLVSSWMRSYRRLPSQHCSILRSAIFTVIYVCVPVFVAKISSSAAFVLRTSVSHCIRTNSQRIHFVKSPLLYIISPERHQLSHLSTFADRRLAFSHGSSMDSINASQPKSGENVGSVVTWEEPCQNDTYPHSIQPLYITIGPPCSGKTTWIMRQSSKCRSSIVDVCIDDQPGVYYALPTSWFLPNNNGSGDGSLKCTFGLKILTKETLLFGKTVHERIAEQTELKIVLSRLANVISADEFQSALDSCALPLRTKSLVEAVEDIIHTADTHNETIALPSSVDLFVLEAIFRASTPSSSDEGEGVTYSALKHTDLLLNDQIKVPLSSPVALGNTNTRAKEYGKALTMAEKTNRPVYFAVFFDEEMRIPKVPSHTEGAIGQEYVFKDLFDFFVDNSYDGLIRRNINRFLQSGRYIPTNVIWDMRERTIELVNSAFEGGQQEDAHVSESISRMKLRFHQRLAQLAGFEMNDDRLVSHLSSKRKVCTLDDHDTSRRARDFVSQRRSWDQPASATRGYRGRFPSSKRSNAVHGYGGQY
jgi:hypothetical protein